MVGVVRFCSLMVVLALAATAAAAAPDYLRDVKPILARRCFACHGALKQESILRLDTRAMIVAGGEGGPAIVPGNSTASPLIAAVTAEPESRMPPEGEPLTAEQIATLRAWIDAGAPAPNEPLPPDPRQHWSFVPPVRPPMPASTKGEVAKNPIDAFLNAALEQKQLAPLPEAGRAVLLRRVYLDLIGLPPSRDELQAFVADTSPESYERVVDRLLASPHYGERWGRHWMDVWRYADWAGYRDELRTSQRHIWRWRDWIVGALNSDKPYDRMILEMVAGDELAPTDPDTLRATGFLARNYYKFNRNVWLDDTVEHTSKAFLGLTMNCCRCHDHMYDPISQQDYFRLRAFFEPLNVHADRVPGTSDALKDGLPRVYDKDAAAPTYLFVRGDERQVDKSRKLEPAIPAFLGGERLKIEPVSLPPAAYYQGLVPFVREEARAGAAEELKTAERELTQLRQDDEAPGDAVALAEARAVAARLKCELVEATIRADDARFASPPTADAERLARAASLAERRHAAAKAEEDALRADRELAATRSRVNDKDKKTVDAVTAAEKKLATAMQERDKKLAAAAKDLSTDKAGTSYTTLAEVHPATSTGRRLALARWIADRRNPRTARVAVNHLWLRHFGEPLVATMFDFGHNGARPTHPELLDWLAVELMEGDWRMKPLHRLIVTSAAYRRQSMFAGATHPNLAVDPENRLLWRMNARRMEAEIVRDSVLHVAGSLDPKLGGPDIDHAQGLTVPRRSIYFRHANEKQMTFLMAFDMAGVAECYQRNESIVPQQALALANSTLTWEQARRLAASISSIEPSAEAATDNRQFIAVAFETILSREPTPAEITTCTEFLSQQAALLADAAHLTPASTAASARVKPSVEPRRRARENLVHTLFNHHDFVTIR